MHMFRDIQLQMYPGPKGFLNFFSAKERASRALWNHLSADLTATLMYT